MRGAYMSTRRKRESSLSAKNIMTGHPGIPENSIASIVHATGLPLRPSHYSPSRHLQGVIHDIIKAGSGRIDLCRPVVSGHRINTCVAAGVNCIGLFGSLAQEYAPSVCGRQWAVGKNAGSCGRLAVDLRCPRSRKLPKSSSSIYTPIFFCHCYYAWQAVRAVAI